jgi:hypothetical protein
VEHGTRIKKFAIELQRATLSGKRTPVVDAARMVKQQCGLGITDKFCDLTGEAVLGTRIPSTANVFSAVSVISFLPLCKPAMPSTKNMIRRAGRVD